jgi:hypothetical protein
MTLSNWQREIVAKFTKS